MGTKNYDPTRIFGKNVVANRVFSNENAEIGKRTIYIPVSELEGKDENAVLEHVEHLYDAFRRAEEFAEAQNFSYTDEEALKRATELYAGVHIILTANCSSVYIGRLEEDNEEARAEQEYLDRLDEKIDINEHIAEALEKSAEVLCKQWVEDNGPEHAQRLVRAANFHVTKQLAAAAILEADEQVPVDAPEEEWREAFGKFYRAQIDDGIKHITAAHAQHEAQDILENDLKPVEMRLKELRIWAGIVYLESMAEHGKSSDQLTSSVNYKLVDCLDNLIANRYETRSQLDSPEGALGAGHRLTSAQMDLMIYILLSSYDNSEGERPLIWSPKAYLGRSPTKTEAPTLSRRVSALVDHGLIKRSGREVSVTVSGRDLIRAYTVKRRHDKNLLKVRLVLELNEIWKNLEALKLAKDVARRHERRDLVRRDGRGPLHDLLYAEMSRKNNLIQQLEEIAD